MISLEKWKTFSKRDQIGHIASEIKRAILADKQKEIYFQILECVLTLIDLTLRDSKWRGNPLPLLCLRDAICRAYTGEVPNLEKIYAAL